MSGDRCEAVAVLGEDYLNSTAPWPEVFHSHLIRPTDKHDYFGDLRHALELRVQVIGSDRKSKACTEQAIRTFEALAA